MCMMGKPSLQYLKYQSALIDYAMSTDHNPDKDGTIRVWLTRDYKCKIVSSLNDETTKLEFETEQDRLLFMLKFGE